MADLDTSVVGDGVHALAPREQMCESARKLRDTHAVTPGAPFLRREFGFLCLPGWLEQGLPDDLDIDREFTLDPPGDHHLGQLGWCEAGFMPCFGTKILEERGDHELEQDHAGRHVLYFKDRRQGFMPEYVDHPVKDFKTWEEDIKWRLDPATGGRYGDLDWRMQQAKACAAEGKIIVQDVIGGFMYLRSLIGPIDLLYMFCEAPDLIHACMEQWFDLADAVIARHQEHVTIDEVFFGEDCCFKGGPLVSLDMMHEFLIPYYQQLVENVKARQIDPSRRLCVHVDTDGFADPVIPIYREIGMTTMSPFEVAADCDVVRTGKEYPDLILFGGIDKRILATTKDAIDRELERILPAMRERGGYIPTCDHAVPEEVPLENYLHYRKRCVELGG